MTNGITIRKIILSCFEKLMRERTRIDFKNIFIL